MEKTAGGGVKNAALSESSKKERFKSPKKRIVQGLLNKTEEYQTCERKKE